MSRQTLPLRLLISGRCSETIYTQRLHLARRAANEGWAVCVAGDVTTESYAKALADAGFPFYSLPVDQKSMNPLGLARLTWAYSKLFRLIKPDVFHAFTIKPFIGGLIAARLTNVPVRVATVTGLGHVFLTSSAGVKAISIVLLRIAMSCAHRVFFYNENDRSEYVRRRIVPFAKTRLIAGSGIDTSRFPTAALPRSRRLSVAFVGRLLKEKGVPELLQAFELLRERGVDLSLSLIGDIDVHNPSSLTREDIDSAFSGGGLEWHGLVADVRPFVAKADVVILPSHREGIPLALLEAAAMGRALIATDVPGCQDVVVHEKTGLLVPLGDVQALADAIERLAKDRDLVAAMGAAAREDVVARFDSDIVNGMVLREYDGLVDGLRTKMRD
jgi:glycosyltransferase involved in cell wall biosynthesis